MDRKTYMKNIYSKYWISARENKKSLSQNDKALCNYIDKNIKPGERILDVGIGTGFPYGDFFQKKGYEIYGIDIAPLLIEKCRKLNNKIICKIGDAENLEYPDNFFKCVYCFHSTYYFPNICSAIDEMVRVVDTNGMVIFDLQNKNNKSIIDSFNKRELYKSKGFRKLLRYCKNIIKIILRKGTVDWTSVVHEVPTYPETIYDHLKEQKIKNYSVLIASSRNGDLEKQHKISSFKDYPRLIFVIWK